MMLEKQTTVSKDRQSDVSVEVGVERVVTHNLNPTTGIAADRPQPLTPYQIYLNDIHTFAMLTDEESKALGETRANAKTNDERDAAVNKLWEHSLRLPIPHARHYAQFARGAIELEDLIQEGNIGVGKAAKKYNTTRGAFAPFASKVSRDEIIRALINEGRVIKIPENIVYRKQQINRTIDRWRLEHERDPSAEVLSGLLDLDPPEVREALDISDAVSLDEEKESHTRSIGENIAGADVFVGKANTADSPFSQFLRYAMLTELNDREVYVLTRMFGLRDEPLLTLDELGVELSLSGRRINDIAQRAVSRLRAAFGIPEPQKEIISSPKEKQELRRKLSEAFNHLKNSVLSEKELQVLTLRCGLIDNRQYYLHEVALELGITAAPHVLRIQKKAIRKLRHSPEIQDLIRQALKNETRFSDRQYAVLRFMDEGLSRKQVAERSGLSGQQVKDAIDAIFDKLGVRTRDEAVVKARELGFIADVV